MIIQTCQANVQISNTANTVNHEHVHQAQGDRFAYLNSHARSGSHPGSPSSIAVATRFDAARSSHSLGLARASRPISVSADISARQQRFQGSRELQGGNVQKVGRVESAVPALAVASGLSKRWGVVAPQRRPRMMKLNVASFLSQYRCVFSVL